MPVMKQPAFTIAVIFLCIASLSRAETPASQPTTEPATRATTQQVARPDANSPMGFLLKYDNLAGQGPEAYHALYSIDTNADSRRLAEVQAKFDAQAGMLQKMVELLWGDDAVDQTLHALGLKTMRDIQSATIKEQGDRARVIFADGTIGPDLIKTPEGWRLNLFALRQSLGVPVDEYLKQIRQLSKIIPDVADGIAGGKLKDPPAVISDIARRLNPN